LLHCSNKPLLQKEPMTTPSPPGSLRILSLAVMSLGLVTVILTFRGMAHYSFPFYNHAYPFAWYGLILFLDGLLFWRWRDGLILRRPREFVVLLFWSAVFWFYFELWNLRLRNWYFVGVPPEGWWSHAEAYLDFATVLPGLFLLYRLLCHLRLPRAVKTRFRLKPWTQKASPILGVLMLVLPLAYPDLFFPLVWGAPAFLLDPLCARYRARSLLEEGRTGEWTALVRLLLAGLVCGGYWELCNYWSLEKWVYTVPFFSQGKLFEMPYLGFLGFPPFAVTCFVMTNAVYLFRRGRHWDPDARMTDGKAGQPAAGEFSKGPTSPPTYRLPLEEERQDEGVSIHRTGPNRGFRLFYVMLATAAVILSEWSYRQMKVYTIDSRAEPLEEILKDVGPAAAESFGRAGWCCPQQVLDHWPKARELLEESTRKPVRRRLELSGLLHMGGANARLLEIAGIDSREELAAQDADMLFSRLVKANEIFQVRDQTILKRRVVAWVNAAKRAGFGY
jgi:hypothetical protein